MSGRIAAIGMVVWLNTNMMMGLAETPPHLVGSFDVAVFAATPGERRTPRRQCNICPWLSSIKTKGAWGVVCFGVCVWHRRDQCRGGGGEVDR